MRADREKWNGKYRRGSTTVDIAGEPELVDHAHLLPDKGLALDLACGRGANALYLGSLGFRVLAIDGAIEGLRICAHAARDQQLPVSPVVMDLDQAVLPNSAFSVISVVRYLNRLLFTPLTHALSPGGVLFYKTFNQRHLHSNPGFNPDFVLTDGELHRAFGELEVLEESEEGESSWILVRRTALPA